MCLADDEPRKRARVEPPPTTTTTTATATAEPKSATSDAAVEKALAFLTVLSTGPGMVLRPGFKDTQP